MSEIAKAEKGDNLSPHNLHVRLRVVEVIVLISLFLNLAQWFVAGAATRKIESQLSQMGPAEVRP